MQHNVGHFDIPADQGWLIERMQKLGYQSDTRGVCFGLANMALQASLTQDIASFNRRLGVIASIPVDQLIATIEEVEAKRRHITNRTKSEIGPMRTLSPQEEASISPEIMQKIIQAEKSIEYLQHADPVEYTRRKMSMLFNAYVQTIINDKHALLSEKEKIILEIPAFFEGIEIYHQAIEYPQLFEGDNQPKLQHTTSASGIVLSEKLETIAQKSQSSLVEIDHFTGIYNSESLTSILKSLHMASKKSTNENTVSFMILSSNHAIHISYNPIEKTWHFVDANQLPAISFSEDDVQLLANAIIKSHSTSGIAAISMKMFSVENNASTLKELSTSWHESPELVNSNGILAENAHLQDSTGASWLTLATQQNDIHAVCNLLNQNAEVNQTDNRGYSPLMYACTNNHLDMAAILINNGADYAAKNNDGLSSLDLAAQYNSTEIIELLLEEHPELLNQYVGNLSPLHYAVMNGCVDAIVMLVQYGADINQVDKYGKSPIDYAKSSGYPEIAEFLSSQQPPAVLNQAAIVDDKPLPVQNTIKLDNKIDSLIYDLEDKAAEIPAMSENVEITALSRDITHLSQTDVEARLLKITKCIKNALKENEGDDEMLENLQQLQHIVISIKNSISAQKNDSDNQSVNNHRPTF